MISTLIALPYEIARLPLVYVDSRLSDRLPETSGSRVTLDRAIGSADKLAGSVLRNRAIVERGADRIERADKLVAAARLEHAAAERRPVVTRLREQAAETAATGRQEAAQKRKAAQNRAASGLEEAAAAEARGKQEAKDKAKRAAAAKKAAADKRAASREAAAEQRKENAESAAEAKKKAAEREAQAERDEARETKQAAAETRDAAERLGDLAEAKTQERKQN